MNENLRKARYGILLGIGVGIALGVSQNNIGLGVGVGVALAVAFSQGLRGKKKNSDDEADSEKAENGGEN